MESADVVVVGSGLAGLVVALNLCDNAVGSLNVAILEKEARAGMGNSIKASSGINADFNANQFLQDTLVSAGDSARPHLIEPLVLGSQAAVDWLRKRLEVDLSEVAQLGGHSARRTHRPAQLPVGAEIMIKLRKAVESADGVTMITNAKVTTLQMNEAGHVTGVEYENLAADGEDTKTTKRINAAHVVIATGGFAANRNLLAKYRPELAKFPATQGPFSTGDGILLGEGVQAGTVDMDKIQVHPTGFVDPSDPDNLNKFLAPEVLRALGGILMNAGGQRFCNELGQRDYITEQILSLEPQYAKTKEWDAHLSLPKCHLVLSVDAGNAAAKHIEFYAWKGFLTEVQGYRGLAESIGCSEEAVKKTLEEYKNFAQTGLDKFGRTHFGTAPEAIPSPDCRFYIGTVTPVLHYTMGGLQINAEGNVLRLDEIPITGLYACGETSGGVHGNNRLAGNALLECVVYGVIVSQTILRRSIK